MLIGIRFLFDIFVKWCLCFNVSVLSAGIAIFNELLAVDVMKKEGMHEALQRVRADLAKNGMRWIAREVYDNLLDYGELGAEVGLPLGVAFRELSARAASLEGVEAVPQLLAGL